MWNHANWLNSDGLKKIQKSVNRTNFVQEKFASGNLLNYENFTYINCHIYFQYNESTLRYGPKSYK